MRIRAEMKILMEYDVPDEGPGSYPSADEALQGERAAFLDDPMLMAQAALDEAPGTEMTVEVSIL